MLSDAQQDQLLLSLFATAEVMGQQLTQGAALLMVEDLREYSEVALSDALRTCRREGGRLTVAGILKNAQAADGHPGKDEAWAIALSASDESETVVITAEIRQAMTASGPVLEAGDKVGARMAFMSAYERLVIAARAEALPAKWEVSLGYDPARRVTAIESAVRLKLISQEAGAKHLAHLRIAPPTQDGQAIAGLITGEVCAQASPKVREKLAEVRCILEAAKTKKDRERAKDAQRRRVETYLRKRQARTALTQLQENGFMAKLNIKCARQPAGEDV
ncbi:hypothetical protein [Pseudomonas entomophila]|uniref:hypothetical protein n=1 Tax=Pseudomonas entomophila TaxID=312306 RepID=UPI001EFF95A6|nr:hypothetical protein [Pseudomonas entomophila]MCG8291938.1 hypothetical protein [Pseudomonas entomophila]